MFKFQLPHNFWNTIQSECGLFNDAVSSSDYIASNDKIIND
jgi:hypothetical protein